MCVCVWTQRRAKDGGANRKRRKSRNAYTRQRYPVVAAVDKKNEINTDKDRFGWKKISAFPAYQRNGVTTSLPHPQLYNKMYESRKRSNVTMCLDSRGFHTNVKEKSEKIPSQFKTD